MSSTVAGTSLAFPASTRSSLRLQTAIALLLALGIASYFWVGSRYPSLLKKLHTGTSIKTSGALSFDAKLPATPAPPFSERRSKHGSGRDHGHPSRSVRKLRGSHRTKPLSRRREFKYRSRD